MYRRIKHVLNKSGELCELCFRPYNDDMPFFVRCNNVFVGEADIIGQADQLYNEFARR